MEPSDHIPNLDVIATSTPKKITKTITLQNGLKAEYRKIINPVFEQSFVFVPMVRNELTDYNGLKINSLQFVYLKDEISEDDFMSIVNSLTFNH